MITRNLNLPVAIFFATALNASADADSNIAAADIGLRQEAGRQVREFVTPPGYQQGDDLITYEGPGWESNKVAFRLYLDGRNALDIFGKTSPALVLSQVGRGADYHTMSDWGMDILKVGDSLGAGGVGVLEDGNVRQIGDAERYEAKILDKSDDVATVRVTHTRSKSCGGDVAVEYSIQGNQRMTEVRILSDCKLPLAAGLVIHSGTQRFTSSGSDGEWQYIARYGEQSLAGDGLGIALFYRSSEVVKTGRDADDDYIVFETGSSPVYRTGAAWARESGGLNNVRTFMNWLSDTQRSLNKETR